MTDKSKVPALDDTEGQIAAIMGALSSAMLTATEVPAMSLAPMMQPIAEQMHAYGVRQTENIAADAVHAPSWLREGVKAQSQPVPERPNMHAPQREVVCAVEAPPIPKKIPKAARAVRVQR